MSDTGLQAQIALYERLLPTIRRDHGDVWAVVSASKLEGSFGTFGAAAEHALACLPDQKVLIRHTSGIQPHVPFVAVDA